MIKEKKKRQKIFIISPLQRCGTNYLQEVIKKMDKSISSPERPFVETYFLYKLDILKDYCNETMKKQKMFLDNKNEIDQYNKKLLKSIGKGLDIFIEELCENKKKIILKCPNPKNIDQFFEIFPDSKLIILMRDGRDTVESFLKSWPSENIEKVSNLWSERIKKILTFIKQNKDKINKDFIIIKYEDLILNQEESFKSIIKFLKIKNRLNYNKLREIDIIGSSQIKSKGGWKWKRVKNNKKFKPVGRWKEWNKNKKDIFKKLAGKELIKLNYEKNNDW